jgi:hypothetical protein
MSNLATDKLFTAHQPEYDHTQSAPLYWTAVAVALVMLFVAILANDRQATAALLLAGVLIMTLSLTFRSLRVVDEGDALAIRFGPLPLWRRRIRYERIASVAEDRTSLVDGWGIHWVPGRGWTYNLWGFDCVRLTLTNDSTVRIGTDDPEGLAKFLAGRCAAQ